jgi:hypothetical protein
MRDGLVGNFARRAKILLVSGGHRREGKGKGEGDMKKEGWKKR